MDIAQLILRLGIAGVAEVDAGLAHVGRGVRTVASEAQGASSSVAGLGSSFGALSGEIGMLIGAVGMLGSGLAALSGVGVAANLQRIQVGFTTLLGSASAAKGLVEALTEMGEATPFQTDKLIEFSRILLATGSTAKGVVEQMRGITNVGAAVGLDDSGIREITRMMSEIRMRPHLDVREIGALGAAGLPLVPTVNAGAGKNFTTAMQAEQFLASVSGQKAFDILSAGMNKAFGSAAQANAGTFLGVMENVGEAFTHIMKPTGDLLIPALTRLGQLAQSAGDAVRHLNEMTGGSGGLSVVLNVGVFATRLLVGSLQSAWTHVNQLTEALTRLAATPIPGGGVGGGSSAGSGFNLGRLAVGLVPAIASIGLGLAGGAAGGNTTRLGSVLQGAGTGAGIGGLGMILGPEVGLITTALGALAGGIYGAFQKLDSKGGDKADEIAKNTKDAASTLKEMHADMIGGGRRARGASSQMEVEMALARMVATGTG